MKPYGWEGEAGHYDGSGNKALYGSGGRKDKEWPNTNKAHKKRLEKKKTTSIRRGYKNKTKKRKNEHYCTKAFVNGGDVGEYWRQIKGVVDNCGDCDCFGGSGCYDTHGGHGDRHGHQSERSGSCTNVNGDGDTNTKTAEKVDQDHFVQGRRREKLNG
uniref:Uncharacterized protein n=1 Tax=Romanomermis culicivorax TaxID=13658 RepID=A0A915LAG5_ROMCU